LFDSSIVDRLIVLFGIRRATAAGQINISSNLFKFLNKYLEEAAANKKNPIDSIAVSISLILQVPVIRSEYKNHNGTI
jgi:hypothetical protein